MRVRSGLALLVAGGTLLVLNGSSAVAQSPPTWGKAEVKREPKAAQATQPAPTVAPVAPSAPQSGSAAAKAESQSHTERPGQFPRVLPTPGAPPAAQSWPEAEIAAAQKQCVDILKGLDVVAVGAEPIRQGECGAAAPIELISVGSNPQVTFSPTVTVTCDMAKALHAWVTNDLQGLARKHLGAPLIRIDTMSSYSCRTAYGRAKSRLSEHGKANAIDIRSFVTARAETTDVLADWGPTQRAIQAQLAAAKAAQQKAEAEKALAAQQAKPPVPGAPAPAGAPSPPAAVAATPANPGVSIGVRGVDAPSLPTGIGLSTGGLPQPSRLGGPKGSENKADTGRATADGRRKFLHGAHETACRIFGTVLGPEANRAHENHFHVDMAKRNNSSFCE